MSKIKEFWQLFLFLYRFMQFLKNFWKIKNFRNFVKFLKLYKVHVIYTCHFLRKLTQAIFCKLLIFQNFQNFECLNIFRKLKTSLLFKVVSSRPINQGSWRRGWTSCPEFWDEETLRLIQYEFRPLLEIYGELLIYQNLLNILKNLQ